MQHLQTRIISAIALTFSLAACGGGGTSTNLPSATSPVTVPAGHAKGAAQFKIRIPKTTSASTATARVTSSLARASAGVTRPQYVSVNTASATITLTTVNGAAPPAGYPAVTAALTTGSSSCSSISGTLTCSISVTAPPGSDAFTITLSDAGAHTLSTNSETVTIAAGVTTTAQPLVLNGIAATYALVPATDAATAAHVSSSAGTFTILGSQPWVFTLEPIDASGAIIIGPGTPSTTLTSPSNALAVTAVNGTNNYTLKVARPITVPLVLTEQSTGGATGSVTISSTPEYWFSYQPSTGSTEYIKAYSISGTTATEITSDTIALPNSAPPFGMAFDAAGNIWAGMITDARKFSPGSQSPLASFPAVNQVNPYYVALDPSGNLWTCAYDNGSLNGNGVVQEFDPVSGALLSSILASTLLGYGPLQFDASGVLWVSDISSETVAGYTTAGTLVRSFDFSSTSSNGTAVAFDGAGHLWVGLTTPPGVGSLKAYDTSTGAMVGTTITSPGLTEPVSINFDAAGNAWVLNMIDSSNEASVLVFSPSGSLLRTIPILNSTDGLNYMVVSP